MSKKSKFRFESVLGLRRSKEEDSKQRLRRARAVESTAAESAQWLSAALVVAERRIAQELKSGRSRAQGAWRMIAAMRENAAPARARRDAGPPDGGGQDQPGAGHEESASRPAGEGPFDAGTGCRRSVGRGTRGGGASRDVFRARREWSEVEEIL